LKNLIQKDKTAGVQKISDLAESAEKRIDARIYKDFEFSLPRELTDEQNIALAKEFLQDQFCKRGIPVLANFHMDIDPKTRERKPHCHAVLLTRELIEEGLSQHKNRDWNKIELLQEWREQLASYTNFYLALHGHESCVDHRSNEERDIDVEPQPKLSRSIQESEQRLGLNAKDPFTSKHFDKAEEYRQVKLRNIYRIMKNPELVFDIVTKNQVTFMWGDVQKVLARYIDDPQVFQALNAKLLASKELVTLRKIKEDLVYTSQKLLQKELSLIEKAKSLAQKSSFEISSDITQKYIALYDQRSKDNGHSGLSPDQQSGIEHMVSAKTLTAVIGYAGTGKTFAVECARDIWQESGYRVVGLAPTGKAADTLAQSAGISAMTVHNFLRDYKVGRNQFNTKTVLVLDEAGMLDLTRSEGLLSAVDKLAVKLVTMGDGLQNQPVEAGPAFRLVTKESGIAHLKTVIRQKQEWMCEATQAFGRGDPENAIKAYQDRGHIHIVNERLPDIPTLVAKQDWQGLVEAYNRCVRHQKLAGWTFKSDIELSQENKIAGQMILNQWKLMERQAAQAIFSHIQACKGHIREMGTDPYRLLGTVVGEQDPNLGKQAIIALAKKYGVYINIDASPETWKHRCEARQTTINRLVTDWFQDRRTSGHPNKHLMLAFTNKDVFTLNQQARNKLQGDGILDKQEFIHTIIRLDENDFGEEIKTVGRRAFAKGDRIQFMKNDNRFGVKNGMVGTIIQVDKQKLQVKLDTETGQEPKTVSFASKLYPYIDHGYALTVNKSQGMTSLKSYVLATNHFIRNLAYVAFTRHTESLNVYYANVEAWASEVARSQLSKVGEKLSSLDYLNFDKLSTLVKQDNNILEQAYRK
ncbi:MAG TPA: AAA family ATPase, partial [Candidatus Nitrosotenuis sp.]|nr:AAA family ATPase [Candidatus Nitrosotenuis sp.]